MFEAKITIDAPQLAAAIDHLATALYMRNGGTATSMPQMPANPTPAVPAQPTAPAAHTAGPTSAYPYNAPAPAPMPTAPAAAPAPVAPNSPAVPPAAGMPLASPPQYTVDQIMQAGAMLMDAGKVNDLMNLLHSFGVNAVMDLKPEQLGAFATEMRKLGAQI